jgi:hypothetical protein
MVATIKVLSRVQPKLRWIPKQGEQTSEFLARKRKDLPSSKNDPLRQVLTEAQTILGRCVPPTQPAGTDTGLVVGYVQSGKTLSFTTILALARDNGYQLVIVIAGIATNLKSQSEKRIIRDLGFEEISGAWAHYDNPSLSKGGVVKAIQNALTLQRDKAVPQHKKRTVLITVLKNHTRLRNVVAVLQKLSLGGVPTLVIDDEADQASLNTKARQNRANRGKDVSATYDWITQVKDALPHHTFLQYTATPQAPLLISIADVLSPSFAELLTPGEGYVGGGDFFRGKHSLVELIPLSDVPGPDNEPTSAPGSLQKALRFFLLGAAAHYLNEKSGKRSMMIHPSQLTAPHADYKSWTEDAIDQWKTWLSKPRTSGVYRACARTFADEYKALAKTHDKLPKFDKLIEAVKYVLLDTQIVEVNSTEQGERDVKWHLHDYWILVGGQKLDRGFTVEGLTVTYMPRGKGTGNADTLQQRARFFGYKASYKGLCRIFLTKAVKEVFEEYVEHEVSIRKELSAFRGRPLAEWKRDFILSRKMAPTRSSVIGIDISRLRLDEDWLTPGALHKNRAAIEHNAKLIGRLIREWIRRYKRRDAGAISRYKDGRTDSPRNVLITGVPVSEILDRLLLELRLPDMADSEMNTGLVLALRRFLEQQPHASADVFLLGGMAPQRRSLEGSRINQVFQGKTPNTPDAKKIIYVGDRALFPQERLALHLRNFLLKNPPRGVGDKTEIPWYAVHLTKDQAKDSVIQARS